MILFLDYDGVLHPDRVFIQKGRPFLRGAGQLFMWASLLEGVLAPFPAVKIVLSTSWVRVRGFSRASDPLPDGIRQRVIGATWHSSMGRSEFSGARLARTWWDEATRYEQIARYVARAGLREWLAIDDHGEPWAPEHRHRLILTDSEVGLSDPEVVATLRDHLGSGGVALGQ